MLLCPYMEQHHQLCKQLGLLLQKKGWHLAVAESCTGGGLAQAITATPSASGWFERGFVTYSNNAKIELLDVSPEIIEKCGAVSEETAREMAAGAITHSHADIVISITGVAGPTGGSPEKPVGTVWFGLAKKNEEPKAQLAHFSGTRDDIQKASITFALKWLIKEL